MRTLAVHFELWGATAPTRRRTTYSDGGAVVQVNTYLIKSFKIKVRPEMRRNEEEIFGGGEEKERHFELWKKKFKQVNTFQKSVTRL